MITRNEYAFSILSGVKCPYCNELINPPDRNFEIFKGLKSDNNLSENCLLFNDKINHNLCTDEVQGEEFESFIKWLEQYKVNS